MDQCNCCAITEHSLNAICRRQQTQKWLYLNKGSTPAINHTHLSFSIFLHHSEIYSPVRAERFTKPQHGSFHDEISWMNKRMYPNRGHWETGGGTHSYTCLHRHRYAHTVDINILYKCYIHTCTHTSYSMFSYTCGSLQVACSGLECVMCRAMTWKWLLLEQEHQGNELNLTKLNVFIDTIFHSWWS